MRKLLVLLGAIACASSALAQTESDPNEGSQITHDAFNGTFNFSWWGRPGNTYFIQHSDDLLNWDYVPIIESGAGETIDWGFTSSADKFFLRLRSTDEPAADPALADVDGDGVGNMAELEQGTERSASPACSPGRGRTDGEDRELRAEGIRTFGSCPGWRPFA